MDHFTIQEREVKMATVAQIEKAIKEAGSPALKRALARIEGKDSSKKESAKTEKAKGESK